MIVKTRKNPVIARVFRSLVKKPSKGEDIMKATGIVRRIEEYGIIGQKLLKPL